MKRIIVFVIAVTFLFSPYSYAKKIKTDDNKHGEKKPIDYLFLSNYVRTGCHITRAIDGTILFLRGNYGFEIRNFTLPKCYNSFGVGWIWDDRDIKRTKNIWDIKVYSSSLTLRVKDEQGLSRSISTSISESQTSSESISYSTSLAKSLINRDSSTSEGSSISQSQKKSFGVDEDSTARIHAFLAKALIGSFANVKVDMCIASAADLSYMTYNTERSDSIIRAYVLYKSVKPEKVEFTNKSSLLNYAKLFYTILEVATNFREESNKSIAKSKKDAAWAQAILFAEFVKHWEEFADVKKTVDLVLQDVYSIYRLFTSENTKSILLRDETLASIKYVADVNIDLAKKANVIPKGEEENYIKDEYLRYSVIANSYLKEKLLKNERNKQEFKQAVAENNPILEVKYFDSKDSKPDKPREVTPKKPKPSSGKVVVIVATIVVITFAIVSILIVLRKKRRNKGDTV